MKSKNLFCMAAIVLFLSAGVLAGQQAPTEIRAVPVADGLYFIEEELNGCNIAFLVTAEGVLVVDSGTSPEEGWRAMAEIAKITDKPVRYVVLTHYHSDHLYGMQAFPGSAVVIAQQNTAGNIRRLGEPQLRAAVENRLPESIAAQKSKLARLGRGKVGERAKAEARLKELESELAGLKEVRIVRPALEFDSKLRITLGGLEIDVIHLGGAHTDGDALVYFPGLKAVHTGDLVFNGLLPYIGAEAGADSANWIAALKTVASWDVENVMPGHGPLGDRQALLKMAAYLSDLREAVKNAVAAGRSLEQAKKMPLLPAWKQMAWPEIFPQNVEAVYKELKK